MPLNWLWGYLLPLGLLMLIWGGLPPQKARQATPLAALALALAILGYWAVGFALHLGGAHAVNPDDPALIGLDRLLAPMGRGWGLMGVSGFLLTGVEATPTALALFLSYLPLMATALLGLLLPLQETRRWVLLVAGIVGGSLVFPIAACWLWGSGWLAHLGETLTLGVGVVDFGGSGLVLWLPGMMALGIGLMLPRRADDEAPTLPPVHFPLLAQGGALLLGLGWMGWALSGPFHTAGAQWDWNRAAVSMLLGMAGAVLTSQLYAWLATGEFEPLLAARGLAAGWGAVLAGAPFFQPWVAVVIGMLAGLLYPFVAYALETRLRLPNPTPVALGITGGLWGLLSVGLFADGLWGQGWNRMASGGVSGVMVGSGGGQLLAQGVGLLALGAWGLLWGLALGFCANPRLPHWVRRTSAPTLEWPAAPESVEQEQPETLAIAETIED